VKKDATQGLLGKASGFSFTPDMDAGWWDGNPMDPAGGQGQLYPKLLRFTCEFSVIHEHHLGWHDCDGKWEVVCGENGQPKYDEDKMGWPYIPYGWSAGEILGQSPMDNGELAAFLAEDIPDGRIADVEKSSVGAQGTTTSDKTKAKNAANPNPAPQPTAQPEAESAAEAAAALGN